MKEQIGMLKGSLDSIMFAVRKRDYNSIKDIVNNIKERLDELNNSKEIRKIFKEIEEAIEETKSGTPVLISESKLLKRIKEIKSNHTKKEENNDG